MYLFIALERILNPTRNLEGKIEISSIIMATSRISLYCGRTHPLVIRLQESLVIQSGVLDWSGQALTLRADIHRHTRMQKRKFQKQTTTGFGSTKK